MLLIFYSFADHRQHRCQDCGKQFSRCDNLATHRKHQHGIQPTRQPHPGPNRAPRPEDQEPLVEPQPIPQVNPSPPLISLPIEHADDGLYNIYTTVPRERPLFGMEEIVYYAQITEAGRNEVLVSDLGLGTVIDVLIRALDRMIGRVTAGLEDDDLVQLRISNPGTLDYLIFLPLQERKI